MLLLKINWQRNVRLGWMNFFLYKFFYLNKEPRNRVNFKNYRFPVYASRLKFFSFKEATNEYRRSISEKFQWNGNKSEGRFSFVRFSFVGKGKSLFCFFLVKFIYRLCDIILSPLCAEFIIYCAVFYRRYIFCWET